MTAHVKSSGAWVPAKTIYVKQAGVWTPVMDGFIKDGGQWKRFYTRGTVYDLLAGVSSPDYGTVRWGYDVFNYDYIGSLTPSPLYKGFPVALIRWFNISGGTVSMLFRNTGGWTEAQFDAIDWSVLEISGVKYTRAAAVRSPLSYGPGEPLQGMLYEWNNKANPFVPGNTYKVRIY